jgi:hypothetical protein
MEAAQTPGSDREVDQAPHFTATTEPEQAWEEVAAGRFMPRRIRGSYRGRALG